MPDGTGAQTAWGPPLQRQDTTFSTRLAVLTPWCKLTGDDANACFPLANAAG